MKNLVVKTKVSDGGRIVIPARMREQLGIEIGEDVTMRVKNNTLQVTTQKEALRRLRAMVRKHVPPGVSLVDELIKERREEAAND